MYALIKLLTGLDRPLTYHIPDDYSHTVAPYQLVQVPLRNRHEFGYIIHTGNVRPTNFMGDIRTINNIAIIPQSHTYNDFIMRVCRYYSLAPDALFIRMKQYLKHAARDQGTPTATALDVVAPPCDAPSCDAPLCDVQQPALRSEVGLTHAQQTAVDAIVTDIHAQRYAPHLIFGVTGSGKSEIYIAAIRAAYTKGLSTIFLLPEVTLATQFQRLLSARLPDITILSLHSATSAAAKRALWKQLHHQKPLVIVGVHLPVTLPIANLGLIIIDEEHDAGYQEKKHPKLNTKEVALIRAHTQQIPIILGSATPCVQTMHLAHERSWQIHRLPERFQGAFPHMQYVQLKAGDGRPHIWISTELLQALKERLVRKEQSIIFLNRRGHSMSVQCSACNTIAQCTACSVSLTLHIHPNEIGELRCHYCGYTRPYEPQCSTCHAPEKALIKKGIGTQQVVSILQKLLPNARIARADLDVTVNRKQWGEITDAMHAGTIDILVGTQTITKGYHFPKVTLVGILWAESNLHIPSYLATEHTVQQLIQVAGRAGRATTTSTVIVQSFVEHPLFHYLNEQQYEDFIDYELHARKELGYPPYCKLAEIELKHTDEKILAHEAAQCATVLRAYARQHTGMIIRGPIAPAVHKISHMYHQRILITAPSVDLLHGAYRAIGAHKYQSSIFFTPNPTD